MYRPSVTLCPLPQVGCFDPYSDDPRLGIQKIHLCKYSGYLTVAGTAGQVSGPSHRSCVALLIAFLKSERGV